MITKNIQQEEIFKLLGVPPNKKEQPSVDFGDAREKLQAIKIKCFEELQEIQKRYDTADQLLVSIERFHEVFDSLVKSSKKEQPIKQHIAQPQNNQNRLVLVAKYPNSHILQKLAARKNPFSSIKTGELKEMMGYSGHNTIYALMHKGRLANQETLVRGEHGYCQLTPLGEAKIKDIIEEKGEIIFIGKCAQVIVNDVLAKGAITHYRISKIAGYNSRIVTKVVNSLKDAAGRNLLQQDDDGKIRMANWTNAYELVFK